MKAHRPIRGFMGRRNETKSGSLETSANLLASPFHGGSQLARIDDCMTLTTLVIVRIEVKCFAAPID